MTVLRVRLRMVSGHITAGVLGSSAKFLPVALGQPIEVISTTIQVWLQVGRKVEVLPDNH